MNNYKKNNIHFCTLKHLGQVDYELGYR